MYVCCVCVCAAVRTFGSVNHFCFLFVYVVCVVLTFLSLLLPHKSQFYLLSNDMLPLHGTVYHACIPLMRGPEYAIYVIHYENVNNSEQLKFKIFNFHLRNLRQNINLSSPNKSTKTIRYA